MSDAGVSTRSAGLLTLISGPIITLALAALTELLIGTQLHIANPPAFFILAIVFSAFSGGLKPGLISAAIAWVYVAYFFSQPDQPFHFTDENLRRVIVWAFAMPLTAFMVGLLNRRTARARVEAEVAIIRQAQLEERARSSEALKASEGRFRALVDHTNDAIEVIDPETGCFLDVNEKACRAHGYTREEYLLLTVCDIDPVVATRPWEETREELQRLGSRVFESQHRRKNGSVFPVEVNVTYVQLDRDYLLAVVRDITERKQAEEKLIASEIRYRRLFESAQDGILILDAETGKILDANPFLIQLLGYSHETFVGKHIWELGSFKNIVAHKTHFLELQQKEYIRYEDLPLETVDGRHIEVEFVTNVYLVNNQKVVQCNIRDVTERKRADQRLAENERRLRTMFESEPECVKLLGPNCTLLEMNSAGLRMIEATSLEQVVGKSILGVILPEYRPAFAELCDRGFRGESGTLEYEIQGFKGSRRLLETHSAPLYNEQGRVESVLSITRDITERKRAEDAVRQSQLNYQSLVSSIDGIVWEADASTFQFTFVSQQAERLLGYPIERWLTEPTFWKDHIHPDDQEWAVACCVAATKERKAHDFEYRMIGIDGRTVWLRDIISVIVENGRPMKLRGVMIDITERKKAEKALKQSEEQYRKFFVDDLAGNYITTPEGEILACNPAFARIFGFRSVDEVLHANVNDFYNDPDRRKKFLQLLREKKRLEYYETQFIRPDGKRVYCVENSIGAFNSQGELVQIQGYLFDDTQRKLLEEELIQAQKMESLGTLAGGIAHDFNNILAIILGRSTILGQLKLELEPEKFSQNIEAITKAADRGAMLVKQLLTFARKREVLFESVNINDITGEIDKLLRETLPKTITVSISLQPELPFVIADAGQLHQVLLNLCVNARDAMPRGGTLSISCNTVEGESLSSRFPKIVARQYVQIKVSDTGVGMDETTRQRIFEPFFTTKDLGKGTGLGLAVVFGIVERHAGFIDTQSVPGEGSSFAVYLPVAEQGLEVPLRVRKGTEEIPGGSETILVIEDEKMLRGSVKAVLVSKGYTVLTAEDGVEGIEVYQAHQKEIAVVLSDVGLPRLDGQDVFRKVRESNPQAKVILTSGFFDPEIKAQMFKAGVKDFIQKPYSYSEILQKIRTVIDE